MTEIAPAEDRRRGIVLMVGGMACISLVDGGAKFQGAALAPLQVVWGYYLFLFAAIAPLPTLMRRRWRVVLASRRPWLQLLRASMLIGSLSFLFASFPYLPLADATAISFASPLFVALLSWPLLGERVDAHCWGALLLGFAGVAIVVRPGSALFHWAALLPVVGAGFFALYQILTRTLARIDEPLTTLLYTAGGGLGLTSLAVPFFWTWPSFGQWALFVLMGALGALAHWLIVRGFTLAPAALLAPFNYTRIVWAVLLGILVFGNWPDPVAILGSALIAASGLWVFSRERRTAAAT